MALEDLDHTDVIRYPLGMLAMCGCFLPSRYPSIPEMKGPMYQQLIRFFVVFIVGTLHLVNIMRAGAFFVHIVPIFNPSLAFYTQSFLFQIYGTMLYVCEFIKARFLYLPVLRALEEYKENFGYKSNIQSLSKKSKIFTYVLIFTICIHGFTIHSANLFLMPDTNYYIVFPLQERREIEYIAAGYVIECLTTLIYAPICAFFTLYSVLIDVVKMEFLESRDEMAEVLKLGQHKETTAIGFSRARERHQTLCDLCHKLTALTRLYATVTLLFNTVIVFFIIYTLGGGRMSDLKMVTEISLLCMSMFGSLYLCLFWGQLPNAAQAITDSVGRVTWSGMSSDLIQQIQLLVSYCSCKKVGIDLYGIFTLDSSSILMLLGTMATYGLVVIQFQQGVPDTSCPSPDVYQQSACNCSHAKVI